jgi:hypothetical protein
MSKRLPRDGTIAIGERCVAIVGTRQQSVGDGDERIAAWRISGRFLNHWFGTEHVFKPCRRDCSHWFVKGNKVRGLRESMDGGVRGPLQQVGQEPIVEHTIAATPHKQQWNIKIREIVR